MEPYIKDDVSDITYLCELIPTNMPKLSKRISAQLINSQTPYGLQLTSL